MKLPQTRAFLWKKTRLLILDQRELPHRTVWKSARSWSDVARAIQQMVVRGAPAIGVTAAYGLVLAVKARRFKSLAEARHELDVAFAGLFSARPTAVNLRWALERMKKVWDSQLQGGAKDLPALIKALESEAIQIEVEDRAANQAMGRFGAALLKTGSTLMTHCNTGSLATAGLGTAFGVLWTAHQQGKVHKVLASETRPYLQGARLTAWELQKEKIPFELITDNMAAHLMKTEKVDAVFVGADRIAANGDTANKIGTYSLAVLAAHHGIPFYIVAPLSTVDLATPDGRAIPIEERSMDEVTVIRGNRIAPKGIAARHPAFDVTPATLITAIITERGVAREPFRTSLNQLVSDAKTSALLAKQAVAS
jgi:methylthioribose-1-phosphate isomerase